MAKSTDPTLTIFYDGLCLLCSKEMDHYKKQKGSDKFSFLDITDPNFSAEKEGVDPFEVHKVMHVKTKDGHFKTGVDAFIEIWKYLPRYKKFADLARKKWLRPLLDVGYFGFAKVRPFLPRKSQDCENSPYCETRKKV
jgi:predicted DCC family thiol-disulfide oxidoreductase YuxK